MKETWSAKIGPLFQWKGNNWNTGPNVTPTVGDKLIYALGGRGKAAEFQRGSGSIARLPWYVLRAHLELLARLPEIWRQRRRMKRRLTSKQFRRLIRRFSISPRQVAAL